MKKNEPIYIEKKVLRYFKERIEGVYDCPEKDKVSCSHCSIENLSDEEVMQEIIQLRKTMDSIEDPSQYSEEYLNSLSNHKTKLLNEYYKRKYGNVSYLGN